jgi:hypothetical protein
MEPFYQWTGDVLASMTSGEWFANSVNLDEVRTAGYTKRYASGDDDQIPFLCNSQLDRCLNSVAK